MHKHLCMWTLPRYLVTVWAMDFLQLNNRNILVFGVANRRSVAWAVSAVLQEAGANLFFAVRDSGVRETTGKLLAGRPVYTCNLENDAEIAALKDVVVADVGIVHGILHSVAFASYSEGFGPFHETNKHDFLQACDISCFSLISIVNHMKPLLSQDASVVTISISTTRMAAENYGYMAPVKAALDSSVVFLAKSLSADSDARVNAVGAGLLKTSASAGIPGYVDSYLYAEQIIPRKRALETDEVARTAAFLLSPASSGINAQTVVVDAGMSINYFSRDIVRRAVSP